MIIAGIDYSLNGPAICVFDGRNDFTFEKCQFYFLTDTKKYAATFFQNIHGKLFEEYTQECERYDSICNANIYISIISVEKKTFHDETCRLEFSVGNFSV